MTRCIAFLRAVNISARFIRMEALTAGFEAVGLANMQTFIASGNVIFETRARDLAALGRKIEARLSRTAAFERAFKMRATFRNITTLRKLLAKLA